MPQIQKKFMPGYPNLDIKTNTVHSPHVIILGAGASLAALPKGDANGRKLPLMNNLIEIIGLKTVMARCGQEYSGDNFEAWYEVCRDNFPELCKEIEEIIEVYFQFMQLPDEPTIYDYLILSLRNKDIIATFNWDPLLSQAFIRNKNVIGYENLPQIVHLHGNVAIGLCYKCKAKGWRYNKCTGCDSEFSPSNLLFPVEKKDYTNDSFIYGEWDQLQRYIQDAYFFTIFGYSAPETDVEAKKLMHEAWAKNATDNHNMMTFIDIKSKTEIKKNWQDFITKDNYIITNDFFGSCLSRHPRRTCEAWAMATLQQSPWKENHYPRDISLPQLQNWVLQLVEEEKSGVLSSGVFPI